MQHRSVAEVMTRDVIAVPPDATFKHIVQLLQDNNISAIPVVDERSHPVGVVSEADLLRKAAKRSAPEGRWAGLGRRKPQRPAEAVPARETTSPPRTGASSKTSARYRRQHGAHQWSRAARADRLAPPRGDGRDRSPTSGGACTGAAGCLTTE